MTLEAGQTVGNYRILRKLGSGGMGEVYLAEHPVIGKTVALKVIHQDLCLNKDVVTRFVNEAKAVSTIGNDHIVEVHDFGVSPEGAYFFIMEYLEGQTLTEVVKAGPLSVADSLHIAAQITAGLAAAHAAGIVHRDLKPDNVMLVEKLGDPLFVKILDFGLAKMLEADQQLTAMGVVLGTPEFMSPEAAESKSIDGRSDIYSLGVLLFQMLTGRLPFVAATMGEMMVQQVCRPPPVPRGINPNIPPSVDQIVLRCLAKAQADRFQSMAELRLALLEPERYLSSSPPVVASEGVADLVAAQHPAMVRPMASDNRTMSILTPVGFKKTGRGRALALAAIAVISTAGGAAAALLQDPANEDAAKPVQAEMAQAAKVGQDTPRELVNKPAEAKLVDAKVAPIAAELSADVTVAAAAVSAAAVSADAREITVFVTSVPAGATVADEQGSPVGTTPFEWSTQAGDAQIAWKFAHQGYETKTHRFLPESASIIEVALVQRQAAVSERRVVKAKNKTWHGGPKKPKRPKVPKKPKTPKNQVGENTMEPDF